MGKNGEKRQFMEGLVSFENLRKTRVRVLKKGAEMKAIVSFAKADISE